MSVNAVNADGSLTRIAGRGTVEYGASTVRTGTVTYATTQTVTLSVVFDTPMPDDDYMVNLSFDNSGYAVTFEVIDNTKTATGFSIYAQRLSSSSSATVVVRWTAFKLFTVEGLSDLESNVTELQAVVPSGASSSNQLALASKTLSVNSSGGSLSGAFTKRIVKINFYGNNLSLEETVFILGMKKNWNTNRYYSEMYLVNISSIGLTVTKLNKTDSVHTNLISNFKLKKESSSSNNYYLEIATNNTGSNDYTFLVTPYLGRATLTPICEDVGDSEEDVYTATINRMITTSDLTSTVTSGSSAPITSGGVYSALSKKTYLGDAPQNGSKTVHFTIPTSELTANNVQKLSMGVTADSGNTLFYEGWLFLNTGRSSAVLTEIAKSSVITVTSAISSGTLTLTMVSTGSSMYNSGIAIVSR